MKEHAKVGLEVQELNIFDLGLNALSGFWFFFNELVSAE